MTGVTYSFYLHSNDLCGAIPAEVATLSSSSVTGGWDITTDTFVGPTPCPAVSALVALYEGTAGSAWTAKNGWMGSSSGSGDPCTSGWYGVSCSSTASGEVTQLLLQSNGLSGSLPTQIGLVTTLSAHLDAYANALLVGTLPTQLGHLSVLQAFAMGEDNFVG